MLGWVGTSEIRSEFMTHPRMGLFVIRCQTGKVVYLFYETNHVELTRRGMVYLLGGTNYV